MCSAGRNTFSNAILMRAYDALHLASAPEVHLRLTSAGLPPLTFLAADDRLLGAATAEGLPVDNPNRYP